MEGINSDSGHPNSGMVVHSRCLRPRILGHRSGTKYNSKVPARPRIPDSREGPFLPSNCRDGKAVLRASIREFLISEHLHALKIPTTRALALTVLPNTFALRERVEPCAIVCRMAESWIRIGTFDLFRNRGDRQTIRKLAEYCISQVYGEEMILSSGKEKEDSNRFERLYREICRRNASTVAMWLLNPSSELINNRQAYGFMNGVLNTDNTSIYGLSLDFGPFAVIQLDSISLL